MGRHLFSVPSCLIKRLPTVHREPVTLIPQLHFNNNHVNSVLEVSIEAGTSVLFKYIGVESPLLSFTGDVERISEPIPWQNDDPESSTFCWARITLLAPSYYDDTSHWIPWFAVHGPSARVTEQEFRIDLSPFLAKWAYDMVGSWVGDEDEEDPGGALEHPPPVCVLELETFTPCEALQNRVCNQVVDPSPRKHMSTLSHI
jgi:hypothetical protein